MGPNPSPQTRLTLTVAVINRATVVLFLVTGTAKADIVKTILEPGYDANHQLPAALVKPDGGPLHLAVGSSCGREVNQTAGVLKRRT
jgi:6-phosphogluconolactonase/glucosamine-6-phosphate isomerase/deaminase